MGVADAAAADREQAGQGLLVQNRRGESTVARIRSPSVIFCRKIPPRVAGSRSWPRRWRLVRRRPRRTPRSGRSWPGRLGGSCRSGWDGTRRCQPVSQPAEFTGGLPVGVVMQRLQGHHRSYLRGRDRPPAHPRKGEQVRIIGIRKDFGPVCGQEREHAARRNHCPVPAASRNCRPARLEPCMRNHPRPSNTKPTKGHHLAAFSTRS
jgi:hypothetical protein